jgi:hypothetical protein
LGLEQHGRLENAFRVLVPVLVAGSGRPRQRPPSHHAPAHAPQAGPSQRDSGLTELGAHLISFFHFFFIFLLLINLPNGVPISFSHFFKLFFLLLPSLPESSTT